MNKFSKSGFSLLFCLNIFTGYSMQTNEALSQENNVLKNNLDNILKEFSENFPVILNSDQIRKSIEQKWAFGNFLKVTFKYINVVSNLGYTYIVADVDIDELKGRVASASNGIDFFSLINFDSFQVEISTTGSNTLSKERCNFADILNVQNINRIFSCEIQHCYSNIKEIPHCIKIKNFKYKDILSNNETLININTYDQSITTAQCKIFELLWPLYLIGLNPDKVKKM